MNDKGQDMTNRTVFWGISVEVMLSMVISLAVTAFLVGLSYQTLASDQGYLNKENDAQWLKIASVSVEITAMQISNAEVKADIKSTKESLKRIEKQNGEILKYLRGDIYRVRDNG